MDGRLVWILILTATLSAVTAVSAGNCVMGEWTEGIEPQGDASDGEQGEGYPESILVSHV